MLSFVLKKLILCIIILFFIFQLFSQPFRLKSSGLEFYDYDLVLTDLKNNGIKSKYYEDVDYEAMLFLDKSCLKTLQKINKNFLAEQSIDTSNIFFEVPLRYVNEFAVNFNGIKELFTPTSRPINILKKIQSDTINNLFGMLLDNQIYIKDNNKAVFSISKGNWTNVYKVILNRGKIRFELLYQIEEFPALNEEYQ